LADNKKMSKRKLMFPRQGRKRNRKTGKSLKWFFIKGHPPFLRNLEKLTRDKLEKRKNRFYKEPVKSFPRTGNYFFTKTFWWEEFFCCFYLSQFPGLLQIWGSNPGISAFISSWISGGRFWGFLEQISLYFWCAVLRAPRSPSRE